MVAQGHKASLPPIRHMLCREKNKTVKRMSGSGILIAGYGSHGWVQSPPGQAPVFPLHTTTWLSSGVESPRNIVHSPTHPTHPQVKGQQRVASVTVAAAIPEQLPKESVKFLRTKLLESSQEDSQSRGAVGESSLWRELDAPW
ncbi:hypothetical protein NDU88_001103 [Pleurodeles waltl]|uniref:Uncharacterized protein n=1 Tax=Pleurodeles waltl TaxID=8319 RepID=A0AAV7Q245_PLEWA|nr:hypothetical protein NDU88_001103 [Pleurodeles waltl]